MSSIWATNVIKFLTKIFLQIAKSDHTVVSTSKMKKGQNKIVSIVNRLLNRYLTW